MNPLLKSLLLISFLITYKLLPAQVNLLQDGSFEDTTADWQNANLGQGASPTWAHLGKTPISNAFGYCNINSTINNLKLPSIGWGWQMPRNGLGVALILNYALWPWISPPPSNMRTCMQAKLKSKLLANKTYCATLYVSALEHYCYDLTDGLAMYFDNGQLDTIVTVHHDTSGQYPFVQPQVQCGFIISDTVNWVKVQGSFVANGTEEYITIGNFIADSNLQIVVNSMSCHVQQILIDDVSLIPLDLKNWLQDAWVTTGDSVWVGLDPLDIPDAQWHQNTIKAVPFFTGPGFWFKPIEGAGATFIQGVEVCGAMVYDTMQVHVVPLSNYELGILNYKLRVYPNPARDVISVEQIFGNTIALVNVLGQVVQTQVVVNNKAQFNVSNLPRGLYSVKGIKQVSKVVLE
jgi:hypothetical protein